MGRRATIPHWTSSLANLSLYRRPTFVHVHVPELAYTQDWVHPSLQLNPSAAGDDRYYQHYPCCAGRLVAKEQWVTAGCWTLMGPPRDRVAKRTMNEPTSRPCEKRNKSVAWLLDFLR